MYGRQPVGVRRLYNLVRGLHPHHSAYARTWAAAGWTQPVELQATTVDLLQHILRVLQVGHLQDPPTGRISLFPRPWDRPAVPARTVSLAEFTTLMDGG